MKVSALVWAHMSYHWRRTWVLIGCLLVGSLVPLVLAQVMPEVQRQLQHRAEETPLVFGGPGSSLELALHALYFRAAAGEPLRFEHWQRFQQAGHERAVPLHIRFRTNDFPIVGTHLEYFQWRGRKLATGEAFGRLGDCVVGSEVARRLRLGVGGTLISSPRSILSIGADYPLQIQIVGVLEPSGSPDDLAVFVDLKTAWVMENLGHGHDDVSQSNDPNLVLERSRQGTVASAAVLPYTVVTEENLASFHFHGDMSQFPLTAIVLLDDRQRQQDLAAGFAQRQTGVQAVFARQSIADLLSVLFQVQRVVLAVSLFVGLATLALFGLVIGLSLQIRQSEMETMFKLGASRGLTRLLLWGEIGVIAAAAGLLATAVSTLVAWLISQDVSRWLV